MPQQVICQGFTQIGGVINDYSPVTTIYSYNDNDVDSVVVADVGLFSRGDTVMLYIVQGAEIATSGWPEDELGRDAQNPWNTGKYAFLLIENIHVPTSVIIFNTTVRPEIYPMRAGEVAQLIRVPSYRNAEVTAAGVSAGEWDGTIGGVVTMFVHGVLRFKGDIDVTGKGFRGAVEDQDYNGECSMVDTALYNDLFYLTDTVRAGLKGEGTTDILFDQMRGRAMNINGGGGGNALFSGGGGGGNWSNGGRGGNEATQCGPGVPATGGKGGFALGSPGAYYMNGNPLNRGNRIFLGGGGGSGTRMPVRITTAGADGGGIVVIVADTIEGNNHRIIADGSDVTAVATGAAGGGGGGGCIALDVSGYKTILNLSAVGGRGGNTFFAADTTGPGGGGGGGIYWLAGDDHPEVLSDETTNGLAGQHLSSPRINFGAADGGDPHRETGLKAPLRGFIFNAVPTEFTVCADELPGPLYASLPRGGDGVNYTYLWVDSSSTQNNWLPAPGVNNQQSYTFPAPLTDTTYFRRIVTSSLLPADTSFRVAVYVHPAITNNTIAAPDTVCSGNAPKRFEHTAAVGGGPTNGSYTYYWQKDEGSGYVPADNFNTGEDYQAPGLTTTTSFVRIVYSGVCENISNELMVKVWERHTNYQIMDNDTVCYNTAPDQLTSFAGQPPLNGDQGDLRYQWLTSADGLNWNDVAGATAESYQPPVQTQTAYFSRIVLSGSEDACVDTSDYVEALNIPEVTGNNIQAVQTVCTGDQADQLTGSDPQGGLPGQYSYQWEARTAFSGWSPVTGISFTKIPYDPGMMSGDTTWYRRVVGSGGTFRNVCLSYSNENVINVLPPVTNNIIGTTGSVLCQGEMAELIFGTDPVGGAPGQYNYRWQVAARQDSPGSWEHPPTGATSINYNDPDPLDTGHDRWYQRIVHSGPDDVCVDTSNMLRITVHTSIALNTINDSIRVCFADSRQFPGSVPVGEEGLTPVYSWRTWPEGEDPGDGVEVPGSNQQELNGEVFNQLGQYYYQRTVQLGACSDTSNTMQVTVMELPGGQLTENAFRACEKDTLLAIELNMDGLTTYTTPWEVYLKNELESGIGPLPVGGDGNLPVTLDISNDSTVLHYEIETILYYPDGDAYACISPPENLSGVVPIHVFRRPEPRIMVDGAERESFKVCGTDLLLTVNTDNGTGLWNSVPAGLVFDPGNDAESIEASYPDLKDRFDCVLTFRSEAGDCYGEDQIDLSFFEQPADAYAGEDTMIFLKNSIQLHALPATAGTGTWSIVSGNGFFEDEHLHDTWVYELARGEKNEFQWTVTNGEDEGTCITSQDVSIVFQNEVYRYKGFSPNGDMDNEYFIMRGMGYADEFRVTFFNSLGTLVADITDKTVDQLEIDESLIKGGLQEDEKVVWDGRSANGKPAPAGTYYYVVTLTINNRDGNHNITSTDSYEYKDYVVLVRE